MTGNLKQYIKRVLVVGGGVGGPAVAIRMAERGVKVDLVDSEKNWGAAGAGVTLSPLTARALCDLGFAQKLMDHGHMHDKLAFYDVQGNFLNEMTSVRTYADDVPAQGGIMRPVLHDLMAQRMRALDVSVRNPLSVTALDQDAESVLVTFTDGSKDRYDMVIGADGLFSHVRDLVMPNAPKPQYTGQVCWRAQLSLPADWEGGRMYFGPVKVGFTPCGAQDMYMYLLENAETKPWYEDAELLPRLRELLAPFGGEMATIRDAMDESVSILARPLESILIEDAWYDGRVVLVGDAVHATTPHLASGAGMAVEDAIVLVDELDKADSLKAGLDAFMARRLPRGKAVVGNSLKLGEMEQAGAPQEEIGALMGASMKMISEPY